MTVSHVSPPPIFGCLSPPSERKKGDEGNFFDTSTINIFDVFFPSIKITQCFVASLLLLLQKMLQSQIYVGSIYIRFQAFFLFSIIILLFGLEKLAVCSV